MCHRAPPTNDGDMTTTPQAAAAATKTQPLPDGDEERVVGFGVMGLPFANGHYLAFRDFPETSFSPAYLSVWHRTPDGVWTFYATWITPWSLAISIDGVLDWRVDITTTAATRMMSILGSRLPAAASKSRR